MQGFGAKRYDLPAPYGLRPKKGRVHLRKMKKLGKNYFTTPQRKLIGYIILLVLTGSLIFQIVPIFKPDTAVVSYELDTDDVGGIADAAVQVDNSQKVDIVGNEQGDSSNNDDEDNDDLVNNLDAKMRRLEKERRRLNKRPNAFKGEAANRKKRVVNLDRIKVDEDELRRRQD